MEILQPKLRFPEFSDDWKLETFNVFFKIGSSKRVLQEDWKTEGIPFFRTRELVKLANNENIKNELFITNELYNELKNKYGIPQIGDLLVSGVGTLGISYVVNNSNPFYFKDGNVIWFKKIKNINTSYFNYIFQNSFVQNQIFNNASITTVGTFTIDNANKTKFYYSNIEVEQTKIANFLSAVDTKINQLNKKKNLLEQYKKGIMQKIFDREIRFKDENGNDFVEWEEKKMFEIGEFKNGINKSKKDFGFGVPFINLMDVFGKSTISDLKLDLVNANSNELKLYELKKGDVLFIRSSVKKSGVGETSVVLKDLSNTVYSGFLIRFRDNKIKLDLNFKKYCFSNKKFREDLISLSSTSANTNINQESLNELKIKIPHINEQIKIANFLSAIDKNINQVTKQLEQTTQYKKGLLQQMFV